LIPTGIKYFAGGAGTKDFGSFQIYNKTKAVRFMCNVVYTNKTPATK
jgi:hypothetical protein